MKRTTIWLCCLFMAACTYEKLPEMSKVDGQYTGTFTRNGMSSLVELELIDGQFNGKSERARFPAVCRGSFSYKKSTITFIDSCLWTTDFDWSLILNGEWNYTIDYPKLILSSDNGDQYVLEQE